MSYALGIDIGTTFTAAAVRRDSGAQIIWLGDHDAVIPSAVFVLEDGSILTGGAAVRRGLTEPSRLAARFKRRMGDSTPMMIGGAPHSAEALTARLLQWVVAEATSREGGPPDEVAVTHPANWGPFKRDRLDQAIRLAGLQDVTTVSEPEAAAIHYASNTRVEVGSVIAVYDLGGGTFDAAVLRKTADGFEVLGPPEGIEQLGGIDFDDAVFAHLQESVPGGFENLDDSDYATMAAVARIRSDCVGAKEALSTDTDVSIPLLLPAVQSEVGLTRTELEAMLLHPLQATVEAMRRAFTSAGTYAGEVTAVLMVGGSSRIPLAARLVGEAFGRPVAVDVHPKHAVALGAALAAGTDIEDLPAAHDPPLGPGTVLDPTAAVAMTAAAATPAPDITTGAPPADSPPEETPQPEPTHAVEAPSEPPVAPVIEAPSPPPPEPPVTPVVPAVEPTPPPAPELEPTQAVATPPEPLDEVPAASPPPPPPPAPPVVPAAATPVTPAPPPPPLAGEPDSTSPPANTTFEPTPPPPVGLDPPDGSGRPKWLIPVGVIAVAAVAFLGFRLFGGGGGNNDEDPPGAVELAIGERIVVDEFPDGLAIDQNGALWVASTRADVVSRIDTASGTADTVVVPAGSDPLAVAVTDDGGVWVSLRNEARIIRLDPDSLELTDSVDVAPQPVAFGQGAGSLWVATADGQVDRIDPDARVRVAEIAVPGAAGVTVSAEAAWATQSDQGTVAKIDLDTNEVVETITLGVGLDDIEVDADDALWVSNRQDGTLSRIDAATSEVTNTVAAGEATANVVIDGDVVWVSDRGPGTVVLVDRIAARVIDAIEVGPGPLDVALDGDRIWVSVSGADEVVEVTSTTG